MIDSEWLETARLTPGRVLVECGPDQVKTRGGIYLSDLTERRQMWGLVVEGSTEEFGPGDWVAFHRWAGEIFEADGSAWCVVRESDVIAVINASLPRPVGRYVCLTPIDTRVRVTAGGIHVAETGWLHAVDPYGDEGEQDVSLAVEERPTNRGRVVAVGAGVVEEIPPGSEAVMAEWAGTELNLAGTEYLFVREADVLGIVCERSM